MRLGSAPKAGALAMMIALAACGSGEGEGNQAGPGGPGAQQPPAAVRIVTIRPTEIANIIELPGRVQAVRTAEVRARVTGIVERRLYEEGTDVRAGTPLFRIDPRELRAALDQARAQLTRAQATAANARSVVARYRPLVGEQAISKQENDAAIAASGQAAADVAQAQAAVRAAQLNLSYTTVTAPISGRVGRAEVTEGALVSATEATLLTRVEQLNPVYVNFSQSNSDLLDLRRDIAAGRVKVPQFDRIPVRLVLEDGVSYGPVGHLNFLDLSVDETTGSVSLRSSFPNVDRTLLPGQFVRARIEAGRIASGIVVPQRAVQMTPQGSNVMVIGANNIATARPVTVGDLQGGNWVIRSGLKPGDRVIVDGLQKVRPGAPVTIDNSPPRRPGAKIAPPVAPRKN